MPLPGECLRHDSGPYIRFVNVIDRDQAALYSLTDEVVVYVDVLCLIVELGIGGELYSTLVDSEDSLLLAPGGSSACRGCGAVCIEQWLPLLCSLVLVVHAEVWRRLQTSLDSSSRSKQRSQITSFTSSDSAM